MRIVVHKYGGSSVKDIQKIREVAEHVAQAHREGTRVVVVVSAMGNTTNELLQLAHKVSSAPSRRELDMLVSVGERIAMALLSIAINSLGVPAHSFTGSQSGIITDESHSKARVVAVRPHRVLRALEEGKVAIVAGFQGVSLAKEVTTLGRGGSDTTAVALAAALGAEWCEIHSDVPGVFSADPRAVPDAIQLDTLSLEEALNMARNGARVLHDEALAFAKREGIALVSSGTNGQQPGTRIQVEPLPSRVTAIVADSELECFETDPAGALLVALEAASATIRSVHDKEVLVDLRNWHDRDDFVLPPRSQSRGRICQVCAVGMGIGSDLALLREGREALDAEKIEVQAQRSLPDALSWWISPDDAQRSQRCLHQALIRASEKT
jgi:aspartate kinase